MSLILRGTFLWGPLGPAAHGQSPSVGVLCPAWPLALALCSALVARSPGCHPLRAHRILFCPPPAPRRHPRQPGQALRSPRHVVTEAGGKHTAGAVAEAKPASTFGSHTVFNLIKRGMGGLGNQVCVLEKNKQTNPVFIFVAMSLLFPFNVKCLLPLSAVVGFQECAHSPVDPLSLA